MIMTRLLGKETSSGYQQSSSVRTYIIVAYNNIIMRTYNNNKIMYIMYIMYACTFCIYVPVYL